MVGIGDNLYARPFVKDIARQGRGRVSLMTGFPQLFDDIRGIRIVKPQSSLPYVQNNIRFWGEKNNWRGAPRVGDVDSEKMEPRFISYVPENPENVIDQIWAKFPPKYQLTFDLPSPTPTSPAFRQLRGKRYVVIRPVVIREGFGTSARNPRPEYVAEANRVLRRAGFLTVGVANAGDGEAIVGDTPEFDLKFLNGELSFPELMELFRVADGVVSGPGFGMLMAVAAKRPLLAIWGARGALDNPNRIFHPIMDTSMVQNMLPTVPCPHSTGECDCDKYIHRALPSIYDFVERLKG